MSTETSTRTIQAVDTLPEHRHGAGLLTRDVLPSAFGADLDPFLLVSLYDMRGPTFPPHPHAGFMVATYILPESPLGFANQDSLGTRNTIAPGALHVTVAGRGVLHEEQPERAGGLARGYQIWIDLPSALRETAPAALHLAAPAVPVLHAEGAHTRVLLGSASGTRSPLSLPTPITLLDVTLAPGARYGVELPADDQAFVFVLDGALTLGAQQAHAGQLVRTRPDGALLPFTGGPSGARFTVFAGPPLRQHKLMQGPFVASYRAQLLRFAQAHASGAFGTLRPMGDGS